MSSVSVIVIGREFDGVAGRFSDSEIMQVRIAGASARGSDRTRARAVAVDVEVGDFVVVGQRDGVSDARRSWDVPAPGPGEVSGIVTMPSSCRVDGEGHVVAFAEQALIVLQHDAGAEHARGVGQKDVALLAAGAVGLVELVERILERAVAACCGVAVDVDDAQSEPSALLRAMPPARVVFWMAT